MDNGTVFSDIFVAVHGIGAQSRFATARSVATRLAGSHSLRGEWAGIPVAPQPLGYFHSDVRKVTSVRLLDDAESLKGDLASIGFAEVFWADIPQDVVKEGRTLEETKAWARTVVARANALCDKAQREPGNSWIVPPDFGLAGEVLEEIIDTVYVLENLFFLASKAGFFKFELRKVLEEYLGDVQLVAEFGNHRNDIIGRFHHAMEDIYEQQRRLGNGKVRIHIVAHSEGTVVSFLGLLHAMSGRRFLPAVGGRDAVDPNPDPACFEWLRHVKGYMTLGSPIDKHILLWRRLWVDLQPALANAMFAGNPIRWRNYYDYGDPVGFKLDSARLWLETVHCQAFEFCGCAQCRHDIGFARYVFPGEAHNEYWNDSDLFEHFIKDVVKRTPGAPPPDPPGDRWYVSVLSPSLPYILSFVILLAGVFVLYKAVHAYTHPNFDPLQRFVRFTQLGVHPATETSGWVLFRAVLGISGLVAGATLLARLPRLARGRGLRDVSRKAARIMEEKFPKAAKGSGWFLAGILALLLGCLMYFIVPASIRREIGGRFYYLGSWGPNLGIMGLAAAAGMSGYLATSRRAGPADRRQRWIARGTRPLIICGALSVAIMIMLQLLFPPTVSRHFSTNTQSGTDAAAGADGMSGSFSAAQTRLVEATRGKLSAEEIKVIQEARLTPQELDQVIVNRGTNWLETVEKVKPVLATNPPVWPVALAGAAFLYLWWLAMLIFDLSFIWHRYVRHSITNDRLREWNPYGFSREPEPGGERCRREVTSGE